MITDHEHYKLIEAVGRLVVAGAELSTTPDGRSFIVLPDHIAALSLPSFDDLEANRHQMELEVELVELLAEAEVLPDRGVS